MATVTTKASDDSPGPKALAGVANNEYLPTLSSPDVESPGTLNRPGPQGLLPRHLQVRIHPGAPIYHNTDLI